jgi:hypothetical protein
MRNYGVTFLISFHGPSPIESLFKRLLLKVVVLTEVYEQLDGPASSLLGCPHEGRPTVAVTRVQVRAVLQTHSKHSIKSVGRRGKIAPKGETTAVRMGGRQCYHPHEAGAHASRPFFRSLLNSCRLIIYLLLLFLCVWLPERVARPLRPVHGKRQP